MLYNRLPRCHPPAVLRLGESIGDTTKGRCEVMKLLDELNACQEAKQWAAGKTLSQAWQECQRADWMLWLLGRSPINKKIIATIAVEFAETCVHNAKDYPAFAECITTVKKYLSGQATQEELAAAESSALAAAEVAEVAGVAASAAEAAEAWSARSAALAAAWSAEVSAAVSAAAAWAAALAAADSAAEADNCEIIRKHVSADEICKLFIKDGVE